MSGLTFFFTQSKWLLNSLKATFLWHTTKLKCLTNSGIFCGAYSELRSITPNLDRARMWVNDSLTLGGKEIPVRIGMMPQVDLRFYAENPRVYSIIRPDEASPSQTEIETRLADMDHVKQLRQSIL